MSLPNFLLVGAGKSATRSLYNYLIQHPDVYMPQLKEPQFFVAEEVRGRIQKSVNNFEQYKKLFAGTEGKMAAGEASVMYLLFYEQAIANIKKHLGDKVKILIILRNPVDRAYSAYNFVHVNNPDEKFTFEEALAKEEDRWGNGAVLFMQYKRMGLYADAVKAYMDNFSHVHIMWYDEFRKDPPAVLKGAFEFLGVNPGVSVDYTRQWNKGGKKWKNPVLRWLFMSDNIFKSIYKIFFPKRKGVRTNEFFREKFMEKTVSMNPETRRMLIEYFRPDIQKLSAITGRDLSAWLK
ncbi:MAG: sulfotransferase domain-containing protein [Chitinophagales bacterium]